MPKIVQWSGTTTNDTTLTTTVARIALTFHRRSSMPKVPKKQPAVTNMRSPITPCAPMVATASPPITASPPTMIAAPKARCGGSRSRSTRVASSNPVSAAQDGWITPP
jgi:hypothetical protein